MNDSNTGSPPKEKAAGGESDSFTKNNDDATTISDTGGEVNQQDWFYKISARLVRSNALSLQARFLWVVIRGYEGKRPAFPGLERLGEITGLNRQTVQKYLRELEVAGKVIRWKERKPNGAFQSTRYRTAGEPQTKKSSMAVTSPQTKKTSMGDVSPQTVLPTTENPSTIASPSEKRRAAAKSPDFAPQSVNFPPSRNGTEAESIATELKPKKKGWLEQ
jgi:hypothetical protein